MQNTLLIFGYGYTGSYVAKLLLSQKGWKVIGTSSSSSLTTETIIIIPYDREAITNVIKLATHILISIPPDENGDIVVGNFVDLLFLAKNSTPAFSGPAASTCAVSRVRRAPGATALISM